MDFFYKRHRTSFLLAAQSCHLLGATFILCKFEDELYNSSFLRTALSSCYVVGTGLGAELPK